ncbi:endonuclease V-like [Oculina patagonica]
MLFKVILVDGNGMLHPRGFGIACHLGVLTDIPTVGVAKTLFHVDGIERDSKHADQIKNLLKTSGDCFPLLGSSGTTWGKALRSTQQACNPIYVSVGHKIGLETAVSLTHACCQYRIPEPIRQADIRSREYLRQHYTEELRNCSCRTQNNEENASTAEKDNEKTQENLVDDTCQTFTDLKLS